MDAKEGTTMTVQAMGKLLGLKKTESYYLLHKHHFETVVINHQLRIVKTSFEQWYDHQDRYQKVNGPAPGTMLQTQFYSVLEISAMLSISDSSARDLIQKQQWPTLMISQRLRVPKTVFDHWYASQHCYRNEEDRKRDRIIEETSMTIPDMGRLLGLDRRQAWELYRQAKDQLELIYVAERPRVTKVSFEKWFANQPDLSLIIKDANTGITKERITNSNDSDTGKTPREFVSIKEAAEYLNISEKQVYRLIERDKLDAKKIGKVWLIRFTAVMKYEEEC